MTKQELESLFSQRTAVIIAPAGHGKTEMIVDMVDFSAGKQLLMTHTHAGVDALQKRLNGRGIDKSKYMITTIAAFCVKWGYSYFHTGDIDISLSPYNNKEKTNRYYKQIYDGAAKIFANSWAGRVIQASYAGIIVDEYQDCLQSHHNIFMTLSRYVPVRVLGDPLQGIFSFDGQQLVNWNNIGYTEIKVDTRPWRWINSNPELGKYLSEVREELFPTLQGQSCTIKIRPCNDSVCIVNPSTFNAYSLLNEFHQYKSVLYITKWEGQQTEFCRRYPGIFQVDEKQECEELFKFAQSFSDKSNTSLMQEVIEFANKCFTKVNAELGSYKNRLAKNSYEFKRITKHPDFGQLLQSLRGSDKQTIILSLLNWLNECATFKCYRKELYLEMTRSIKYAYSHNISIFEAAMHIRKDPSLQKRYSDIKYLSSRTLLSKGLEFDCVLIDMTIPLSAKEFYVAMTRAKKKVYIISSSSTFYLTP